MENNSSTSAPGDAAVNGGNNSNDHTASNGNGATPSADGTSGDVGKKENGQMESKEEGAVDDDGEDMEIEAPPKPDPMVDYTDEFGRVRTMLQRCVQHVVSVFSHHMYAPAQPRNLPCRLFCGQSIIFPPALHVIASRSTKCALIAP